MRRIVSAVCVLAASLLIAASMAMNWSFWTGQGSDPATALVLGVVSIGIDGFKASLPLIIAWSWGERFRLGCAIATFVFCGCLVFSFLSAIGFAASSRGSASAHRETVSVRHAAAEEELGEVKDRLSILGANRPKAVIEEAIARAKQDRRWSSSNECKDATVEASRAFCRDLGDLRIELASAIDGDRQRSRASLLQTEIEHLLTAGARLQHDQQAGVLPAPSSRPRRA